MIIKEIIVKNLTSYADLHLKIDGTVSYFIGENSAGKTNILKILNSFFNNDYTDIVLNNDLQIDEKVKKNSYTLLNIEFTSDELHKIITSNQRYNIITLFSILLQDYYIEVTKNGKKVKNLTDKFNVLLIKEYLGNDSYIDLAFPSNKNGSEFTSFRKHTAGFLTIFGLKSDIANIDSLLNFYLDIFKEYRGSNFNIKDFKKEIIKSLNTDIENAKRSDLKNSFNIEQFLFNDIPKLENRGQGINSPYETIIKNNNIFYYYIHSETTPEKFLYHIKDMIFHNGQESDIISKIKSILHNDIIEELKKSNYFNSCYSMEGKTDIENNDLFFRILNDLFSGINLKKDGNNILTLGSGERKSIIIDILKSILNDKSKSYGLVIIGFDEPETALNEKKKKDVFNDIREISSSLNTQVFVTTHYYSPLSDEKLGNIFLVNKRDKLSEVYRADIDRKNYISILRESIGYGQFDVIKNSLSKHWLLLEGETDYNYIDKMMMLFNESYWMDFKDKVNITWCGGAERVISVFISTILLSPPERVGKLFALFDNDIKVNKSSQEYENYMREYTLQLKGFESKYNVDGGNFFIDFIYIDGPNNFRFINDLNKTQLNSIEDILIPEIYIEALENVLKSEGKIDLSKYDNKFKDDLIYSRNNEHTKGVFEEFYNYYEPCLNLVGKTKTNKQKYFMDDVLKNSGIKAKTSIEYSILLSNLQIDDKKYDKYYKMWEKYFNGILGKIKNKDSIEEN